MYIVHVTPNDLSLHSFFCLSLSLYLFLFFLIPEWRFSLISSPAVLHWVWWWHYHWESWLTVISVYSWFLSCWYGYERKVDWNDSQGIQRGTYSYKLLYMYSVKYCRHSLISNDLSFFVILLLFGFSFSFSFSLLFLSLHRLLMFRTGLIVTG